LKLTFNLLFIVKVGYLNLKNLSTIVVVIVGASFIDTNIGNTIDRLSFYTLNDL